MEASTGRPRRVDVGFAGGQVLPLRLATDAYDALRSALIGEGAARWQEIESEDHQVLIDLSQVVYVRLDTERERIGF